MLIKVWFLLVKIHRINEAYKYNFTCLKWVSSPWLTWCDLRALSLRRNDMNYKGWLSCCSISLIDCSLKHVSDEWNNVGLFWFSNFDTICHLFPGPWKRRNEKTFHDKLIAFVTMCACGFLSKLRWRGADNMTTMKLKILIFA